MNLRIAVPAAVCASALIFTALLVAQAPQPQQQPAAPPAQQPPPAQPAPTQAAPAQPPQPTPAPQVSSSDLVLNNASLNDVVERLGRLLRITLVYPPAPGLQ